MNETKILVKGRKRSVGSSSKTEGRKKRSKVATKYEVLWKSNGHTFPVYSVQFDRSGQFVITGADDYLVKLWNVNTGQLVFTFRGHIGEISIVAVSPDNALLATACVKGYIRLWRLRDGVCAQVLFHGKTQVTYMTFDEDSGALITVAYDGNCIVWDTTRLISIDKKVPLLESPLAQQTEVIQNTHAVQGDSQGARLASSLESSCPAPNYSVASTSLLSSASSSALLVDSGCNSDAMTTSSSITSSTLDIMSTSNSTNHSTNATTCDSDVVNNCTTMFRWSKSEGILAGPSFMDAKLVLPHFNEAEDTSNSNATLKIECVDVFPGGNVLVTGANDGVARVWRFGDELNVCNGRAKGSDSDLSPLDLDEADKASLDHLELLRQMKESKIMPEEEIEKLEVVAAHILVRLEGHTTAVTDIHFSNGGERILTASMQDGKARVWAFSKDWKRHDHIVLDVNNGDADTLEARSIVRLRKSRGKVRSFLYNCCWTADDQKIVTLQSVLKANDDLTVGLGNGMIGGRRMTACLHQGSKLKVWDSVNGDLIQIIPSISAAEVRTLCPHPIESNIVLTTGTDGIVNVWDIDRAENVLSEAITSADPDTGFSIPVCDGIFSSDGSHLALSDGVGNLTILGTVGSPRPAKVKPEQYFSTDYALIMHNALGFAIDCTTQLPVHETPPGLLIQVDGTVYKSQPTAALGPEPITPEEQRQVRDEMKATRIADLGERMDRTYAAFHRNRVRGRHQSGV